MTMAKAKPAKIAHGSGVCELGYKMIRDGKDNATVLAAIQKKFPDSRCGIGGVGWMRNKLRKAGEKIKTNLELKAAPKTKKPAKALDPAA